jgi:YHS domain-containing protein
VDEVNVSKGLTLDGAPLALRGVDPVTLAMKNEVAAGVATRTVVHDGVAYYFASDTSADAFMAAPEKYMPQYGGYCAFAVALGKKLDGDPRYADIVDGKLYLFVNAGVFAKYKETPAEILATAEKTWGKIADKAVSSL